MPEESNDHQDVLTLNPEHFQGLEAQFIDKEDLEHTAINARHVDIAGAGMSFYFWDEKDVKIWVGKDLKRLDALCEHMLYQLQQVPSIDYAKTLTNPPLVIGKEEVSLLKSTVLLYEFAMQSGRVMRHVLDGFSQEEINSLDEVHHEDLDWARGLEGQEELNKPQNTSTVKRLLGQIDWIEQQAEPEMAALEVLKSRLKPRRPKED